MRNLGSGFSLFRFLGNQTGSIGIPFVCVCVCVCVCVYAIVYDLDLGVRERGNGRRRILFAINLILGFVDFSCGLSSEP